MQRGGISDAGSDAGAGAAGGEPPRPRTSREVARRIALGEGRRWWSEPRSAVLIVLGGVVLLGGGWRLLHAWKGRRLIARLEDGDLTAAEVEAVAPYGRAALTRGSSGCSARHRPASSARRRAARSPRSGLATN
ncbi:MAG: hypothetical protein U0790_16945 [Isosphaeraceae bacterium]